jgi:hypothetical protein
VRRFYKAVAGRGLGAARTRFSDLANQLLWQGLVVGNLERVLGRFVPFQFLAKCLQRRR